MQSLVLPRPAFTPDPFGQSRFNPSPNRLPLDRSRSSDARGSRPRAHHLFRSMSPRLEEQTQTFEQDRRLQVLKTGCSVPTTDGASKPVAAAATLAPLRDFRGSQATLDHLSPTTTAKRRLSIAESLSVSRNSPSVAGPPPLQPVDLSVPSTTTPLTSPTTPPDAAALALPPKSVRRTKAHVASACINCKKKHLGCDSARPCRRCVASGKATTCVDVTHKKRGRPPLKAEEPSIRTFTAHFEPPTSMVDPQQAPHARSRLPGHRATSSRELRPMTDLFAPGTAAGSLGLRAAPGPPQRWSASAVPSVPALDPILPLPGAFGPTQRSYSVGTSQHSLTPAHHGQHHHRGYNTRDSTLPSLVSGSNQPTAPPDRPLTSYSTHPPLPPTTSPPQFRQPFGAPISPSLDRARLLSKPGAGASASELAITARDPLEIRSGSPVQLPPILSTLPNPNPNPVPGTSMHAHRLSDPSPSLWLYRTGRDDPPPSLPLPLPLPPARYYHSDRPAPLPLYTQTEPVSPMTRFKELPIASTMNQTQQYVGNYTASGSVAGPPPTVPAAKAALFSAGATPDRPRTATTYTYIPPQSGSTTRPADDVSEPEDSRPVKRRKMAVNDMVND